MNYSKNVDGTIIANRIVRILCQYDLRIAYGKAKAGLYEEEEGKYSALCDATKAAKGKVAKEVWTTYVDNLTKKKEQLEAELNDALQFYSATQKEIWIDVFVHKRPIKSLTSKYNLCRSSLSRIVSAMRRDMEMRFDGRLPAENSDQPNWNYKDLASFLTDKPSADYMEAVKDLVSYGLIDVQMLDTDESFQSYLDGRKEGE